MDHQVLDETTPQATVQPETTDGLLARIVDSASKASSRRVLDLRVEGGGE
jgi:hypothetical protein